MANLSPAFGFASISLGVSVLSAKLQRLTRSSRAYRLSLNSIVLAFMAIALCGCQWG